MHTCGKDGDHKVEAEDVVGADVVEGQAPRAEEPVHQVVAVRVELQPPEAARAEVERYDEEANSREGAEADGGEVEADEDVAPHGGGAEEADELERADGLHGTRDDHVVTVGEGGGAGAVRVAEGVDDGPVDPAEGHAGNKVEQEAVRRGEVDPRDARNSVDVVAAGSDDTDQESVEEIDEEEGVDEHIEEEGAIYLAEFVGAPKGELKGYHEDGADEEGNAERLEAGVEERAGVDEARPVYALARLALLDAKDALEKVCPQDVPQPWSRQVRPHVLEGYGFGIQHDQSAVDSLQPCFLVG